MSPVIAVDGPSGSGKSSVSRAVARSLGVGYLDTGAMYRALTWWCLARGIDLTDREAVARAGVDLPLEMGTDPAAPTVCVGGEAIDAAIRTTEVSTVVSTVATNLDVRAEMRRRQRALMHEIAERTGGVVAEGRDITTVVAPDADVRLLTASERRGCGAARPSCPARRRSRASTPPGTRSSAGTGRTRPSRSSPRLPTGSSSSTPPTSTSTRASRRCSPSSPRPRNSGDDDARRRTTRRVAQQMVPAGGATGPAHPVRRRGRPSDRMLPAGPVIVIINHTGFLDGPFAFGCLPRAGHFLVLDKRPSRV